MDEAATMHDDASSWTRGTTVRSAVSELAALARTVVALPWRNLAADTLEHADHHPVPVVLIHGIFGDGTNFTTLRRHLARNGMRRFATFAYLPRIDYPHLAHALASRIDAVRRATGSSSVDIVGHSLGGLVARYFMQTGGSGRVRRLVTLGTPYLAHGNPQQELAVFGRDDLLVPPPRDRIRRRQRIIDGCGHLGLLSDQRALDAVVHHLASPRHLNTIERAA
jgi:pimeloyl-ACP methyl ester carboxylesterase